MTSFAPDKDREESYGKHAKDCADDDAGDRAAGGSRRVGCGVVGEAGCAFGRRA